MYERNNDVRIYFVKQPSLKTESLYPFISQEDQATRQHYMHYLLTYICTSAISTTPFQQLYNLSAMLALSFCRSCAVHSSCLILTSD